MVLLWWVCFGMRARVLFTCCHRVESVCVWELSLLGVLQV
jgi:hypothetical protein